MIPIAPFHLGYPFPEVTLPGLFVHAKQQDLELLRLRILIEKQGQLIEAYKDKHKDSQETISLLKQASDLKDLLIKNLEEANRHNFEIAANFDRTFTMIIDHQNQGGE